MTMPRRETVDPASEGTYHCWSRCVRRAFLCGFDRLTGRNFEHRREWAETRLQELSEIFAVSILAYAIMENHNHVVLKNHPSRVASWSDEEVARRWYRLFPKRRIRGLPAEPSAVELENIVSNPDRLQVLRLRLCDISWFMRCLKEHIAKRANFEDGVTGCFWESRYRCSRLEHEGAVLACMAYVDLNPVRAGKALSPENSVFTSAYQRIRALQGSRSASSSSDFSTVKEPDWLAPLAEVFCSRGEVSLQIADYLSLLDSTGRQMIDGKSGAIPSAFEPILTRLSVQPGRWMRVTTQFSRLFPRAAGTERRMRARAACAGRQWLHGVTAAAEIF